jgi:hypothetical protein
MASAAKSYTAMASNALLCRHIMYFGIEFE